MARRRMFSLDVVDTDNFLDLPPSAQALYFNLGMRADDEGFCSAPKKITRMTNCGDDDLKLLIAKGYVIPFPSGVCVITDWKRNNLIQNDRFHETDYADERQSLAVENGRYIHIDTECIQVVSRMEAETSLVQPSSDKESKDKPSPDWGSRGAGCLAGWPDLDSVLSFSAECGAGEEMARTFYELNSGRNWSINGNPIRDWKKLFRSWAEHEKKKEPQRRGVFFTEEDLARNEKYCL